MPDPKPNSTEEFNWWGATPPSSVQHEDVRAKLKPLMPNSWRLSGNQLIGMTELGELVQHIPTDYILVGTDDEGLPIFKRIDVK